jgi:hypothetical protein
MDKIRNIAIIAHERDACHGLTHRFNACGKKGGIDSWFRETDFCV